MIRLIEALNFRCLRYIRQPLRDFQILIGPNASGKTPNKLHQTLVRSFAPKDK